MSDIETRTPDVLVRRRVAVTIWAKMPWGWIQRGPRGCILPAHKTARVVRTEQGWLAHHRDQRHKARFQGMEEARAWAVSDAPELWAEAHLA